MTQIGILITLQNLDKPIQERSQKFFLGGFSEFLFGKNLRGCIFEVFSQKPYKSEEIYQSRESPNSPPGYAPDKLKFLQPQQTNHPYVCIIST